MQLFDAAAVSNRVEYILRRKSRRASKMRDWITSETKSAGENIALTFDPAAKVAELQAAIEAVIRAIGDRKVCSHCIACKGTPVDRGRSASVKQRLQMLWQRALELVPTHSVHRTSCRPTLSASRSLTRRTAI
jgi:hypothetical protein